MTCLKCSILLCSECLPSVSCCPQCKAAPVTDVFAPNNFVSKQIKTIKVECTLCSWSGDFSDFTQVHTVNCTEVLIKCKHKDCTHKSRRSDISDHQDSCQHYIVRCPFCDTKLQFKQLKEHQLSCEECQLCGLCQEYQLRSSFKLHKDPKVGWCSSINLACIYSDCDFEGSHQTLAGHYQSEHKTKLDEVVRTVLI
ncbi:hypothetical protein ACHWQZ_G004413 [Mnemiopsis leidyi]